MENESPLLIHVGFPKAGSTWLQRSIFSSKDAGFCVPWGMQADIAIEHVRVADTFIFDEMLPEYQGLYTSGIEEAKSQGLIPVVSYEHLLLDPLGGKSEIREGIRRLKALFQGAKILLVIREQNNIILSSYLEHLRRGFPVKIERYMGVDSIRKPGLGCACPLEFFLYDRLIKYLYSNFGTENVLIYPLELLSTGGFAEVLYSFLGTNVKNIELFTESSLERQARKSDYVFLRYLNHIGMSRYIRKTGDSVLRKAAYGLNLKLNPITPDWLYKSRKDAMVNEIKHNIGDFFVESNERTSELINIDLRELGYS